MLTCCSRNKY